MRYAKLVGVMILLATSIAWGQPPMPFRYPPSQVQVQTQISELYWEWNPKNWVWRIIPLKAINPWLVMDIFGGIGLSEENYTGGGRGGGGYGGGRGGGGGYGGGYTQSERSSTRDNSQNSYSRY